MIKALYRGAKLLIMDEPIAAVLTPHKTDELVPVINVMDISTKALYYKKCRRTIN